MKTYKEAERAYKLLYEQYPTEIINLENASGKHIGYAVSNGQHIFHSVQEVERFLVPTPEYGSAEYYQRALSDLEGEEGKS